MEKSIEEACPSTVGLEYPAHIQSRAADILANGDPMWFFVKTWRESYAVFDKDEALGALCLCVFGSTRVINSEGVHANYFGRSGKGKSAIGKKMAPLFPSSFWRIIGMTPQALKIMKDLEPSTVIVFDDAPPHFDYSLIKRYMTMYQFGLEENVGGGRGRECIIPARIGLIMNQIKPFTDEQMYTRVNEMEIPDNPQQDEAIFQMQCKAEFRGFGAFEASDNLKICRRMWEIITEEGRIYEIRVPFANAIVWADKEHPRSFMKFLDLIDRVVKVAKVQPS
jgi:hypothetical protein